MELAEIGAFGVRTKHIGFLDRKHALHEDFLVHLVIPPSTLQKRRRHVAPQKREKRPRINEEIHAPKVLLVSEENAEELNLEDALARAKEEELDLIEVSPKAKPPVVKIADFGRYLYGLKKKEQKQKSHNKQTEVKMLRFSFRTDTHDMERLMDRAREFFTDRHLVKFVVRLRGREMTNKSYAKEKLMGVVEDLKDVSEIEQELKPQGNQFSVILRPRRDGGVKKEAAV